MVTISLCMIVKDEKDVIGRCLESVADLVDEIIVVDTGSTDRTMEIVAGCASHIVDFPWVDDFAAPDAYGYTPCIQLCVCYSRMGDQRKAAHYNELAAAYRPGADAVAHNRAYFAGPSEGDDVPHQKHWRWRCGSNGLMYIVRISLYLSVVISILLTTDVLCTGDLR